MLPASYYQMVGQPQPLEYQIAEPALAPPARQVRDNYNQDQLYRFRGTLARVRRKAMLSKDPRQLTAYLQLAGLLGIDPSFSNTGRVEDRQARAVNKYQQDAAAASLFQSPMQWINQ